MAVTEDLFVQIEIGDSRCVSTFATVGVPSHRFKAPFNWSNLASRQ
ncbi:predicted protein [Plenodomus lingam JN3]|uniref:Uncharacterized protein n=1 Tax=Leptosphaeria maculans (strain JN3 / isolate v23.1.3 / race Av1-4-5-6-7-8) TaxID=985895 RepID=M1ZME2_LEPMJ|nr:predicted protein [Plenodomus lingam JN3]